MTKTFTTTAILQQVAAGTLTLDSTIAEMLPDLATRYPAIADITVEQLAGMTSGIQDYANTGVVINQVVADPHRVFTVDELIDAAMALPLAAPGTGGYSTTNTLILGQMLEKLTGKPVEQVVTELAASVGMTQSALQAPDRSSCPIPRPTATSSPTGSPRPSVCRSREARMSPTGRSAGAKRAVACTPRC